MLRRFFLKLSRRRSLERELDEELAFHREMAQAGGNSIPLGSISRIKEASGDPWRFTLLETLWRDVAYGSRGLCRSPALTCLAVISLALGIGSSVAVFSVVNAVLLKAVPVPGPDRFVVLVNTSLDRSGEMAASAAASPAKFAHWQAQSSVLQDVSAYSPATMNYAGKGAVEQVRSLQSSVDLFRCIGTPMLEGRTFTKEEDSPNGPRVVVISQNFWARRLAGDPRILGQTITLSGEAYRVIGIMAKNPSMLEAGPAPDVVVPFQLDPASRDQGNYFSVAARLKPGISLEQAKARLQASAVEYRAKFPDVMGPNNGFSVMQYREAMIGSVGSLLLALAGAVTLVLLIAYANVANLLLVRTTGRRREIAVRLAIGAGRVRIMRQLMTESLVLSLPGGALGLLLGYAGIRALLAVNTAGLPRVGQNGAAVAMDWRVALFALALTLLSAIVCGLVPSIHGSRAEVNSVLKESSGRMGAGPWQNRARSGLVVGEISLAVILLVGSGLLMRTYVTLHAVDPGFETKTVAAMSMSLTGPLYQKSMGVAEAVHGGLTRIRALPGVVAAAAACCVPLEDGYTFPFHIIGVPTAGGALNGVARWSSISPEYFDAFKIPVRRGRTFTDADDGGSTPVALINQAMANRYWKGSDPLKDRIVIGRGVRKEFEDEPPRQIVGIVGDVRDGALSVGPRPGLYVPQAQLPDSVNASNVRRAPLAWVVRTQDDLLTVLPAVQEQLRQATNLPVFDARSMDQVISHSTGPQRFNMLLMMAFGLAALLLAATGIYGLMAHSVEQSVHDSGVRLALGADANRLRMTVFRQGMALVLAGILAGLGAAFALARFVERFLFGVRVHDPFVFIAVPLVVAMVGLLAIWLPAKRAGRVSPADSLRL